MVCKIAAMLPGPQYVKTSTMSDNNLETLATWTYAGTVMIKCGPHVHTYIKWIKRQDIFHVDVY